VEMLQTNCWAPRTAPKTGSHFTEFWVRDLFADRVSLFGLISTQRSRLAVR
jgi:hypothetical protein